MEHNQYELKNCKFKKQQDSIYANGNVYGNPKFPNGFRINTSKISEIIIESTYFLVKTLNSQYICNFDFFNMVHADLRDSLNAVMPVKLSDNEFAKLIECITNCITLRQEKRKSEMLKRVPNKSDCIVFQFSNLESYYFKAYTLRIEDKVEYSERYSVHTGMFQDSVLIRNEDKQLNFCFFPYLGNRLEFYSWDQSSLVVYAENTGSEAIEVDTPHGRFLVPAGECYALTAESTIGRIDQSIVPAIDKYNIWEVKLHEDGQVGYTVQKKSDL